ncbi:MAG: DUF4392 domain-containing protein [Stomatobaculum sp.]|nr:DUF4392 domain-containing protein [Stomatobaculum sp.]
MKRIIETIEDIVLRHSSRGMTEIRDCVPENYCFDAAREILSWERGTVLLTTGFYVAGFAETDGPLGTVAAARALKNLGFNPVIVTDRYCEGYFEPEGLETVYLDLDADDDAAAELLEMYHPVGLISIERCGRDKNGVYANMRGIDIGHGTAPCDALFTAALGKIPTIGVGDGGNEIGMGNVARAVEERLSLTPSEIRADILVIATVSNWGAYGIAAALSELTGKNLLMTFAEAESFLRRTVELGSVDGISHEHKICVDGFGPATEQEILEGLHSHIAGRILAKAS